MADQLFEGVDEKFLDEYIRLYGSDFPLQLTTFENPAYEDFLPMETNPSSNPASHETHHTAQGQQSKATFEEMAAFSVPEGIVPPANKIARPQQPGGGNEQHSDHLAAPLQSGPWAPGRWEALRAEVGEAAVRRKSAELEQKLNSALVEIARLSGQLANRGPNNQAESEMDDSHDSEDENTQEGPDALHISSDMKAGKPCKEGCYHCPLDSCDETRKSKRDMDYHIRTHTRPEICEHGQCKLGFPTRRELFRHTQDRHQDDVEGFYCTFNSCGRSKGNGKPFKRRDNARSHMRSVHWKDDDSGDERARKRRRLKRSADFEPIKIDHTGKPEFR